MIFKKHSFFNSFACRFLGKRGISLVELLVSVAMVGGLALAIAELMRQTGQVTSKNRTRYDESEFLMVLHNKLMQPAVCEKNFPVGDPAAVNSIASLLDTDNSVLAAVGSIYGENEDLEITAMSSTHDANSSWLKVNIEFTKQKTTSGPQVINRSLLVFAEVDGSGDIVRCLGSSLSVEDSAWDLACTNNTSAEDRDVMITMADPADATKTLCVRKGINTEGCGFLDPEMIYEFSYNGTTKLYDATCSAAYKSYLCMSDFLMLVNADGTAYCDGPTQLHAYQPYNTTNDAGAFVSGPPTLDCTGRIYSGLEAHADGIRVLCGGAKAGAPTATPTPTPTNTPTPTPTSAGGSCASPTSSYSYTITKAVIPLNTTTNFTIQAENDCDGYTAIPTPTSKCTDAGDSGPTSNYVSCTVSVTNVGGTGGNYTFTFTGIYPHVGTTTETAYCNTPTNVFYSGLMGDSDWVKLTFFMNGLLTAIAPNKTGCMMMDSGFVGWAALPLPWINDTYHTRFTPVVNFTNDGSTFTPMRPD